MAGLLRIEPVLRRMRREIQLTQAICYRFSAAICENESKRKGKSNEKHIFENTSRNGNYASRIGNACAGAQGSLPARRWREIRRDMGCRVDGSQLSNRRGYRKLCRIGDVHVRWNNDRFDLGGSAVPQNSWTRYLESC